jgi:DNA polymerase ligase (LigD)-like protein
MPRFVVLRHQLPAGESRGLHWDLMFEWGQVLRTWALKCEPLSAAEIDVEQLPDHRLAYLDYEGPVSGDRGSVTRWDAGEYRLESESDGELKMRLEGARLVGLMTLVRRQAGGHSWRVSFGADPTTG